MFLLSAENEATDDYDDYDDDDAAQLIHRHTNVYSGQILIIENESDMHADSLCRQK